MEKPVECGHCQKEGHVTYKEIANGISTCTEMCSDCPILAAKLHGESEVSTKASLAMPKLCCALCMTTLETIQTGNPLGCNHCYNVFEEPLLGKLITENRMPSFVKKEIQNNPSAPLHRGKSPKQALTIPLSNELATLSIALNEALQKEHYEQAAWLRDQIKQLKEKAK